MALVLLVLGCVTACIARVVAGGIVEPVNQLIDVVHALNKLDFSRQVRKRTGLAVEIHMFYLVATPVRKTHDLIPLLAAS